MPKRRLNDLPFEVLNHIVEHIDDLHTIINLSKVSRRFHNYTEQDGYRVFILKHHPLYLKSGEWKDAIQSLTALSVAWRRKAFIARNLRPLVESSKIVRLPDVPAIGQGRQSMGYQPVIDCYQSLSSGQLREVLSWGAGAELVIRFKNEKPDTKERQRKRQRHEIRPVDGTVKWITYKPEEMIDGRDDITAVKLLRSHQAYGDGQEHIILGRANGLLQHLTMSEDGLDTINFEMGGSSIDCADVNTATDAMIATCYDNKKIVLYRVKSNDSSIHAGFSFEGQKQSETTWTLRFLQSSLLAVGQGSTKRPLSLLKLTPSGLVDQNFPAIPYNVSDAIYAIEPLADNPNLFLTGHYSGHVQLNDMRIPNGRAAVYDDPVDCSPIHSLLSVIGPRFIAGGARHCLLKFFDMRRPNWSFSSYTHDRDKSSQNGYNVFLPTIGTRMTRTSPTYCLAASSPHAGSFYAGIENGLVQLDLHSVSDDKARPTEGIPLLDRSSPTKAQIERETESLRLVEHISEGNPVLLRQSPLNHADANKTRRRTTSEYDDRWADDFGYDSYASIRRTGRASFGNNALTPRRFGGPR